MSSSGALGLVQPAPNRVFQRDTTNGNPPGLWTLSFNKGWGTVSFLVSPIAMIAPLEYRVRDAAGGSTPLLDWTVYSSSVAPGPQTITLALPARTGWCVVDFRGNSDPATVVTTSQIGMGEVIAATGQSLATDFWCNLETSDPAKISALGITPGPYGVCLAAWEGASAPAAGTSWLTPGDSGPYNSSFAAEFLRLAVLGSGVNCALIGYGYGSEPITSWNPSGGTPKPAWTLFTATLDNALGLGGKMGTLIWCHGHSDARIPSPSIDGDELTTAQYLGWLTSIMTALRNRYSGPPTRLILSSIPAIGPNWITLTPKFVPYFIEQIRAAHLQYLIADSNVVGHIDGLDVPLWSDQTHPSQAGNITFARHFYRSFMRGLSGSVYGDAGPKLTGVAYRSPGSNQITLSVTYAGGSALTCAGGSGGAASQFQVFKSGSTALVDQIAVLSADLTVAGRITITLASAPSDKQALDVWYRLPPDGVDAVAASNQIYDNNWAEAGVDGLTKGRQLAMFPAAISIPSLIWHQATLVGPGVPMCVSQTSTAFVS